MIILFWVLGAVLTIIAVAIVYFKKVPHGWVQLKTGLALQFLAPLDSAGVVQLRHGLEKFVDKQRSSIAKSLPVKSDKYIDIPTRHHRRLTKTCGSTVVSLEYSLSPEIKFPHAHEECYDAVTWITKHLDQMQSGASSIYLVGDSAGGNLVVSTIYEVDAEVRKKISHAIPVYPAIDGQKEYFSNQAYANGYYLTGKAMAQFTEAMLTDEAQLADRRMSPILLDMVDHYPKTFIITADYDPLRDQGEAYAAKIKTEGADVRLKRYHGTVHAFFGLKGFGSRGVTAVEDIARFLKGEEISER